MRSEAEIQKWACLRLDAIEQRPAGFGTQAGIEGTYLTLLEVIAYPDTDRVANKTVPDRDNRALSGRGYDLDAFMAKLKALRAVVEST